MYSAAYDKKKNLPTNEKKGSTQREQEAKKKAYIIQSIINQCFIEMCCYSIWPTTTERDE